MYRLSQLMTTPVASQCSSGSEREYAGKLSPTCIFPSFACDLLAGDSSFDCCSIDPLTGSYLPCRRSPRLLTNGYYIWKEDSFLCDRDGNVTLSPSQTSVIYKENSVRIFRKKKRIRRSLSSFFNLRASKSWLRGSIFGEGDSSPGESSWMEGVSRLDVHHGNEGGADSGCWPADDWEPARPHAAWEAASSSGRLAPGTPGSDPRSASAQPGWESAEHRHGDIADHSRTRLLGEISFQTALLAVCLIISACARWLLGGLLAGVFTCSLMVTVAYVVQSLFLGLASYRRAAPGAGFAKI